jgi:hypothetical protein
VTDAPNPAPEPRSAAGSPRQSRPGSLRRKAVAVGTIAVLAGIGGVALNSNRGMPPQPAATVATAGHKPIVTRTSGSAGVARPVAAKRKQTPATPIVTRTSGGRGGGAHVEDD